MKITWFGTASLLIEYEGDRLLIDPFLTLKGAANHPSLLSYLQEDSILITHGHIDHLHSVPKIMANSDATVYCSATPAKTLQKKGVDGSQIVVVRPDDRLIFGKIRVTVLKGQHITFDKKLIRQTLFSRRILQHFSNLLFLGWNHPQYPENEETLIYQIEAGGKVVLVLGSLGLDDQTVYPKYADMVIIPYQGVSDLIPPTLSILHRIQPRTILLDHFDDAFPPISSGIDTRPLKKALAEEFPDLPAVKPTAGKPVTLL